MVSLSSDLTVFVGENNGGKSNAIDALRLVTTPLGGRREIYCEHNDIRFGSGQCRFELEARFAKLSVPQQGRLISAAADTSLENAVFGLTYDESKGRFPVRPTIWAGIHKDAPEAGAHEMVRHVYLPPLRDAKRALASGNPTRIYALLNHFLGTEDPEALARQLRRDASSPILGKVDGAVDVGLKALTSGVRRQAASLGFDTGERLIDIARDLRFKLADHGIQPEDLRYSGHGYANLLYMATIAVELEKVNNADLTLFLVEEPEAHLHPQLQAAVLCFLEEQAEKSKTIVPGYEEPAGQVQVVVATHSPNLSAWVECKKLVFFKSLIKGSEPTPPPVEMGAAAEHSTPPAETVEPVPEPPVARRATRCIPLKDLALDEVARRKIDRYLDVTKSAFLFGGRILLVEGIAEALLLPILARDYVFKDDVEKYRLFRSAVFVPIDGIDFEPYVRLLLTPYEGIRIADRVVVVTDGDRSDANVETVAAGQERKTKLEKIATEFGASSIFDVVINTYSLESELFAAGNADVMKKVYLALHPKSEHKWDLAVDKINAEQAVAIQDLFKSTRKGDFAQLLAEEIGKGAAFKVPDYIKSAIEAVVK